MNFDERVNAIGTILRTQILPRYKMPDHLSDETARAEIADMVNDLNSEWPVVGPEVFRQIGERFASALRKEATSRTWPTIGVMLKALRAARVAPTAKDDTGDGVADEVLYGRVVAFWRQCRGELKSAMRPGFVERMVREKVATLGELSWHGFALTYEQRERAGIENAGRFDDMLDRLHEETAGCRAASMTGDIRAAKTRGTAA